MSSKPALFTIGDSRFYGTGGTPGTDDPVTQLAGLSLVGGGLISSAYDFDNRGVPGRLLDEMVNTLLDRLLSPDANPLRSKTIAWLWGGVNDPTATGAQLLAWTTTFCQKAQQLGILPGVVMELPAVGAGRQPILNTGILALKAAGQCSFVARTDLIADLQNTASAAYNLGSPPHLTPYGSGLIAGAMHDGMLL